MTWRSAKLSEVADIERHGIASDAIEAGTRYLGLEHIEAGGTILGAATVDAGDLASTKFRFTSRHVLYGKLRPYLAKIATPDFDGICSTDIVPIMPGPRLDRSFLTHFLRQPSMIEFANSRTTGANLPRLSPKALADFEIPLPPLEEQKRIAAILDQADALRRKRQRALDRLGLLGQAIFYEMFVEGQRDEWPTLLVEQLVDENSGGIRTGPFGSQLLHSEFVDDGVSVLGIDNAVSNRFQWGQRRHITLEKYNDLKRYRVYPGDVIITIMGTCGRCAIVPPEIPLAINTKHLCCISLQRDACAPEYLHSYFLTHPTALEYLRSKSKGAIMDGLNMGIIKAMPIRLPPLNLQKQFVERLNVIEEQRVAASDASVFASQLFISLQHRAFRGELTASSLKEAAA